jgi:peptide/nickel transport system substrate-binding protein
MASMRKASLTTAAIMVAALISGGCAGDGGGAEGPAEYETGGTFAMNLNSDPGTIHPYQTTYGIARQIFAFSYDTLVGQNTDGTTVPQLAEKWSVKPDEVTFTLRKGVTCADGSALKASDVAADFDYIKAPETKSAWLSLTLPVDYEASADDTARTVTITTEEPFGLLLRGAGSLPIVCADALENPKAYDHKSGGTGPYEVTDFVPGDHYTLALRPDYAWGPAGARASAPGQPKTVTISFVTSETTSANQLVSGQINAAQITGPDRGRLEDTPTLKRADVPVIAGELMFNEADGRVLSDHDVRRALAQALNRDELTKVSTDGRGKVATNLAVEEPVLCPGDETTGVIPDEDVAAAKKALDAAGWRVGAGGIREKDGKKLTLNLIYQVGFPQTVSATELVGQQWRRIGVDTKLKGLTDAAFAEVLYSTMNFDVFYSAINLDLPFMYSAFFGGPLPPDGGRNSGSVENREFDTLSRKALAASGSRGCDLWQKAHKSLIERVDVYPISVSSRAFYLHKAELETVGLFAVPTSIRLLK